MRRWDPEVVGQWIQAVLLGTGLYLAMLQVWASGVSPFRYQGF